MFNLIPLELLLKVKFNIIVDMAMNGQEAVEMFKKNHMKTCCDVRYKIVFMDINMPIMDGYQATSHIL
jgi:two-component system sensor histidine kinase/response regulator